jgi:hypothetical protein
MYDHTYYIGMVLADHNEYGGIGQYHMYDHTYYVVMLQANYNEYDEIS